MDKHTEDILKFATCMASGDAAVDAIKTELDAAGSFPVDKLVDPGFVADAVADATGMDVYPTDGGISNK